MILERALISFFRPIARFALQRGVGIRGLIEALRVATVQAAEEELLVRDGSVNRNRLSVITGLYRADIERIQAGFGEEQSEEQSEEQLKVSPTTRMLTVWETSARYRNSAGRPRLLTKTEFTQLASSVSKTVHAGSILRELIRSGSVKQHGKASAKAKFELVRASHSLTNLQERVFSMIADDQNRLFLAAEANLSKRDPIGELHHRTSFDNIYSDAIPAIRDFITREGRAFHQKLREFLSQHDQDINPSTYDDRMAGAKVAVTSFSFTGPIDTRESNGETNVLKHPRRRRSAT